MARIALILPRLSRYGGVEQFAFRLAEALAETRNSEHEVEFICARSECLPPVGVRTHIVGRPGGLKFIKMLWFLIRAEQVRKRGNYDLVISLGKTWNQEDVYKRQLLIHHGTSEGGPAQRPAKAGVAS